jgi:hypothetical protein
VQGRDDLKVVYSMVGVCKYYEKKAVLKVLLIGDSVTEGVTPRCQTHPFYLSITFSVPSVAIGFLSRRH